VNPARLLLAMVPLACSSFELDPIEIDVSSNCNRVAVLPRVSDLDGPGRPWDRVLAMAVDAPGLASGWMLVLRHDTLGPGELALVYLDDAGAVTLEQGLDQPPGAAASFELLPSAEPGVAWLTQALVGSFTLWKLDAGALVPVSRSPNLAPLPLFCDLDHDDGNADAPCDAWMWSHRLLFVGQRPHVFAVPPATFDIQIDLWMIPLDWPRDAPLSVLQEIVLSSRPACEGAIEDVEVCDALLSGVWFPKLELIGAQRDARRSGSMVALYRELDDGSGVLTPDVASFSLDPGNPIALGTFIDPGLPIPRDAGARGVAQDVFSGYLHYSASDGEPVLAQLVAKPGEPFVSLGREGLQLTAEHELVQLDDDIAMHRVVDGDWEILKVFPDAPSRSRVTTYAVHGEIVAAESAGPSSFLVRRDDGGTELVQVVCDADGSAAPTSAP
jgi:hypothetical protein